MASEHVRTLVFGDDGSPAADVCATRLIRHQMSERRRVPVPTRATHHDAEPPSHAQRATSAGRGGCDTKRHAIDPGCRS